MLRCVRNMSKWEISAVRRADLLFLPGFLEWSHFFASNTLSRDKNIGCISRAISPMTLPVPHENQDSSNSQLGRLDERRTLKTHPKTHSADSPPTVPASMLICETYTIGCIVSPLPVPCDFSSTRKLRDTFPFFFTLTCRARPRRLKISLALCNQIVHGLPPPLHLFLLYPDASSSSVRSSCRRTSPSLFGRTSNTPRLRPTPAA